MKTQIWNRTMTLGDRNTGTVTGESAGGNYLPVRASGKQGEIISPERTVNVLMIDESLSTAEPVSDQDTRAKLTGEKEAATMLVSGLPPEARLSIIAFSEVSRILFPLKQMGENKLNMIREIQACQPRPATAMSRALIEAERIFNGAPSGQDMLARLFIMSDGMPTDGSPLDIASRLKGNAVQIHCLGFGCKEQIDEDLLRAMASVSEKTGEPFYHHFSSARNLTQYMGRQSKIVDR